VEWERLPYWPNIALGGMRGPIDRTIYAAGKYISGTMMDLLTFPERLNECKEEWKRRIAKEYEEPQLNASWDPPIDLPWPEYVVTDRGYDWHIPTPKS
jgi:aminobenzoyl-glutamate utilization protein B